MTQSRDEDNDDDVPADRQQIEGDGAADDLLHVRADDGQLHHQPQDDPRHL